MMPSASIPAHAQFMPQTIHFQPVSETNHLNGSIQMKPLSEQETTTLHALLARCTSVLPEGFRVDLSADPDAWAALSRALGSGRVCTAAARWLNDAYRAQFREPFLFSERCMTFELKYHLNAYLCVQGFRRTRHVSTLLFSKATLERKCRSIEIDTNDVYRKSQRLAFRYFFGIANAYRRTARYPYAKALRGRYVRIPFYRF